MKYLPAITASLLIFLATVAASHAQNYVPLAPLPIGAGGSEPDSYTMPAYISGAIKLLIALGGGLAILMAIIGGTQYVAAGISPDAKSNAKARMTNAFIGLALIISSYLILNSINPKLVKYSFPITPVTPPREEGTTVTVVEPVTSWSEESEDTMQVN